MISPQFTLLRLQVTDQQFQESWFTHTIRANDSNTTAQVNTEISFDKQRRLSIKIECDICKCVDKID